MSESVSTREAEPRNVGRDAAGIVLFALAAFATISVYMALRRPAEGPGAGLVPSLAASFLGAVGVVPALVLTVGVTLLGARLWLFSRGDDLGRHLLGLVGVSLGASVLAGAVATDAGGALGALSGEKVTAFMSSLVGIPFGLACMLLPVWWAWARPRDASAWDRDANSEFVGQDPVRSAAAPASEIEGVSADEAAALLPTVPPAPPAPPVYQPPASPYPPDVRLQGRIPEGARPIYTDDQPRPEALQDSTDEAAVLGGPVEPEEPAAELAGADLAGPSGGPFAIRRAVEDEPVQPPPVEHPDALESPDVRPLGDPEPADLDEPVRHLEIHHGVRPVEVEDLPRPSWEQGGLFGEEPVDAYGTPLSVLKAHRGAGSGSAVVDPPDLDAEEEISLAERAAHGADEGDSTDDEEPDVALADRPRASPRVAVQEEQDLDEEQDEDAALVLAAADEEEEEDDEADEDDDEFSAGAELEEVEDDDGEEPPTPEAASARPEPEPAAEPEPAVELEPTPSRGRTQAAPRAPSKPARPAKPARKAAAAASGAPDRELVQRAGSLFVERGRVAVSMLQREFGLDFQRSTEMLDRLQQEGLIGPYMGGQRRDILMTAEEWERHVTAS